jgi:hypothetical protein
MNTIYKVPNLFLMDSMGRDIIDYRDVEKVSGSYAWVALNDDEIWELRADAQFYSDALMVREFGPEYRGLCKSAAATVRWINKQLTA